MDTASPIKILWLTIDLNFTFINHSEEYLISRMHSTMKYAKNFEKPLNICKKDIHNKYYLEQTTD